MLKAKLPNNVQVRVTNYDDGIAGGIRLVITDRWGNESEVAIDQLKDSGEIRALVYPVGQDEPEMTSLNF